MRPRTDCGADRAFEDTSEYPEWSLYLAACLLPFALLQYPFGRLSDRRSPAVLLAFGGIAYAALFMMVGYLTELQMLVVMVGCGTLIAMLLPALVALVGDLVLSGVRRSAWMGSTCLAQ